MTSQSALSLLCAKRLVIKIGSALIADTERACPRLEWMQSVAADIAFLCKKGVSVVIVSSGAIALARRQLGLVAGTLTVAEKQAAASVGQMILAQCWRDVLAQQGLVASQILFTADDTEDRQRYLRARDTFEALEQLGCVPVVNENDTISTYEIRFGDNDRLAARVAQMIGADQLVLLSDIDGLYTADPRLDETASHIPIIKCLTPEIEAMGGEPPPGYSSGGMRTKLVAASIATQSGCAMAIAKGTIMHPLKALLEGGRCSWFLPEKQTVKARQKWILGALKQHNRLIIDDGAVKALSQGGSLLPSGILTVEGTFTAGEPVRIFGKYGSVIAHGVPAYSAEEIQRLVGCQSEEIFVRLGRRGPDEIIHHNDLVL
ncbi:glutamate 5-kinase [Acetobacteraceae bacterium ESL0709]|nr:glutamate 5-kinase [Acetobacteraceae bacterium ESL0697]MDF7678848.1 glutamate 5-kinase [Acetobacteraceae bacterium ESL0709]